LLFPRMVAAAAKRGGAGSRRDSDSPPIRSIIPLPGHRLHPCPFQAPPGSLIGSFLPRRLALHWCYTIAFISFSISMGDWGLGVGDEDEDDAVSHAPSVKLS